MLTEFVQALSEESVFLERVFFVDFLLLKLQSFSCDAATVSLLLFPILSFIITLLMSQIALPSGKGAKSRPCPFHQRSCKSRPSPPPQPPASSAVWVRGYHVFEMIRGEDYHHRFKIMELYNQKTHLLCGMSLLFCIYFASSACVCF